MCSLDGKAQQLRDLSFIRASGAASKELREQETPLCSPDTGERHPVQGKHEPGVSCMNLTLGYEPEHGEREEGKGRKGRGKSRSKQEDVEELQMMYACLHMVSAMESTRGIGWDTEIISGNVSKVLILTEPRFGLIRVTKGGKGDWKAVAQYQRAGEKRKELDKYLSYYLGKQSLTETNCQGR